MTPTPNPSSVDDLNRALRLYRRLLLRLVAIALLGLAGSFALGWIGTVLSPPYGIYIAGEGLGTWGLLAALLLLVAEFYWEGWQIGDALNEPTFKILPIPLLMSGLTIIAQRAKVLGLETEGRFGPLRPTRQR